MNILDRRFIKKSPTIWFVACLLLCGGLHAAPVIYTDEASYLAAVDLIGYTLVIEGFEGSDWGVTRGGGAFRAP